MSQSDTLLGNKEETRGKLEKHLRNEWRWGQTKLSFFYKSLELLIIYLACNLLFFQVCFSQTPVVLTADPTYVGCPCFEPSDTNAIKSVHSVCYMSTSLDGLTIHKRCGQPDFKVLLNKTTSSSQTVYSCDESPNELFITAQQYQLCEDLVLDFQVQ